MIDRRRFGRWVRPIIAVMTAVIVCCPGSAGAASGRPPSGLSLQKTFEEAAREFGVPIDILLAVSYNETRWEDHDGAPSTSGGYGPMHLTHVDTTTTSGERGPGRRTIVDLRHDPQFHTLDAAARLLHEPVSVLERDPMQNICGGAALLAAYARRSTGPLPVRTGNWYGAVARYMGPPNSPTAQRFADDVYATIRHGVTRTTSHGQTVVLQAMFVIPDRSTAGAAKRQTTQLTPAECPPTLVCHFVPAAHQVVNLRDPTDFGNYDMANRGKDGLDIRYIIIHDTEGTYNGAIQEFQNPTAYASANYVIRASDGDVTQMVRTKDIAWHAKNYYVNMHAIGIEHEGVAIQGATWYSEPLYQASATLVQYLADRYHIPLDRAHILGHDEVPGGTPGDQSTQHWDPGPYWDWAHYMELLNAPVDSGIGVDGSNVITITPDFSTNQPPVTYCDGVTSCKTIDPQPSNFLYLYAAPSLQARLLSDPALHTSTNPGTTRANDWGDKAVTGEQFYRVARQGDWDEIDYGGQTAWLYDPSDTPNTTPSSGQLIMPAAGRTSIPVYGCAYPEKSAYPTVKSRQKLVPLQYRILASQMYVATDLLTSDFYWSPTMTRRTVVKGHTHYYQIFFNHRIAFVRAGDVQAQPEVQAPGSFTAAAR